MSETQERTEGELPKNFAKLNKQEQQYWITKANEERREESRIKLIQHLTNNPEELDEYITAKKEHDRLSTLKNRNNWTTQLHAGAEARLEEQIKKKLELHKDDYLNDLGQFNNYLSLAKNFIARNPLHYDTAKIWWRWSWLEYRWEMIDETTILIDIDDALKHGATVQSKVKGEILEALRREARRNKPLETPKTWVQFKDKIIDISTGEEIPPTPKYFLKNPIKWNTSHEISTPTIDRLFQEWVGADNVKTLKQIVAYCTLPDYPIHRIFVLLGAGTNGKSTFLRLLSKFIGQEHIASTELDLIANNRFEISKLHGKLICQLGETNDTDLKHTSMLKKISGGDLVSYEFKGKNAFDDYNYAKILIATNTLPITHDKTDGFFRRWLIIDFPNQFKGERDVLAQIPDNEYESLATQCVIILQELFNNREFHNEGSLLDRRRRYEDKSNPLVGFIQEMCIQRGDCEIPCWKFIEAFQLYLNDRGYMTMSKHKVGRLMKNEGFESIQQKRDGNNWKYYVGIELKSEKVTEVTKVTDVSTQNPYKENQVESTVTSVTTVTNLANIVLDPCEHGLYPDEKCLFCEKMKEKDRK